MNTGNNRINVWVCMQCGQVCTGWDAIRGHTAFMRHVGYRHSVVEFTCESDNGVITEFKPGRIHQYGQVWQEESRV